MELIKTVCIRDVVYKNSVRFDENNYLIKEEVVSDFKRKKKYIFLKKKINIYLLMSMTKNIFLIKLSLKSFSKKYIVFLYEN